MNNVIMKFLPLILYVIGVLLVGELDGFYDAVGVFFMLWGHQLERH